MWLFIFFSDEVNMVILHRGDCVCFDGRSLIAAYLLVLNGYKNVFHLEGGLYSWFKEGLPAVTEQDWNLKNAYDVESFLFLYFAIFVHLSNYVQLQAWMLMSISHLF